jgi:hypothetical protein
MNLIIAENVTKTSEITIIGLAIVLWISMYCTYWACGKLFDYKCDIFNIFKKKKKSRRRS